MPQTMMMPTRAPARSHNADKSDKSALQRSQRNRTNPPAAATASHTKRSTTPFCSLAVASWLAIWLGALFLCTVWLAEPVNACNEQVCASVVSKCMLTASCKCDLKNCSCCKECFNCLSYLYTECCSCVDMCPKPNATRNGLSSKSHVEDLEGIPGLFKALTDVEEDNWSTMTYPVDFDAALYGAKFDWEMAVVSHGGGPKQELEPGNNKVSATPALLPSTTSTSSSASASTASSASAASPASATAVGSTADVASQTHHNPSQQQQHHQHQHHHHGHGGTVANSKIITYNCTVAFMSQCLSWNKCKTNCQSMGASSYRWFHDGCCECVGSTCLNYGVNESRCMGCPEMHGSDDGGGGGGGSAGPYDVDELDYGHVNGPMDGGDMNI